jgi:hypothetical protein
VTLKYISVVWLVLEVTRLVNLKFLFLYYFVQISQNLYSEIFHFVHFKSTVKCVHIFAVYMYVYNVMLLAL